MIQERRKSFIKDLQADSFVQKNAYKIQDCQQDLEIAWKSNRSCDKWIEKQIAKQGDLIQYGYFKKSDGSCPNRIVFRYNKAYWL